MEVHIYKSEDGFSPFRLLTLMPVEFVDCINHYLNQEYIVVLCAHGKTGSGAHVDSRFNQLSGWNPSFDPS